MTSYLDKAEGILSRISSSQPINRSYRQELATVLQLKGRILQSGGDYQAWTANLQCQVEIMDALNKDFPQNRHICDSLAMALANLAAASEVCLDDDKTGMIIDLRTQVLTIYESLAERHPSIAHYQGLYFTTAWWLLHSLRLAGDAEAIDRLHERIMPHIDGYLAKPDDSSQRLQSCALMLTIWGDHYLEYKDYRRADEVLSRFGGLLQSYRAGSGNEAQVFTMLMPARVLEHWADAVAEDMSLPLIERRKKHDFYKAQANMFREKGLEALEYWLHAVSDSNATQMLAAERLLVSMAEHKAESQAAAYPVTKFMFERVVQKCMTSSPADWTQCYMAQILATAPRELRDVDLALQIAKRGIALQPDEAGAWDVYGWALFRADDWEGCLRALERGSQDQPSSIKIMALWQLRRHDEALALFADEKARVEKHALYFHKLTLESRWGVPTARMYQQLYEEARILLGQPDEYTSDQDAVREEGKIASDP